jgi:hypothetical protein
MTNDAVNQELLEIEILLNDYNIYIIIYIYIYIYNYNIYIYIYNYNIYIIILNLLGMVICSKFLDSI